MTVSEDVPARPSRRVARVLDALRYMVALLVLCFAVVTFDAGSAKWGVLTLAIGVAVFCSQLVAVTAIRLVGLWFGVFYVLQALATPLLPDPDFVTLEPNYVREFEVVGGLPGISGVHRVTTDHQGFRTTRPVDYDSPAPLRIFMIGGSTIEQILLDDRKTSPHLLQEMLQEELGIEVEVVNTGVSGLRAVHHLATLRAIKDYHPDLVLFMLGVNDWNWHISFDLLDPQPPHRFEDLRLRNTPLGRTLQSAYLALKGPSADGEQAASPGAGPEIERGAYYDGKQNSLARDIKIQFLPDRVSDSFAETLGLIMSECKTLGIDCIFATQPNGYQEGASQAYKESFWMTPPNGDFTMTFDSMVRFAQVYNSYLVAESARRGFPACDPAAGMEPSFASFYDEVHFNEAGARKLADLLLPCVLGRIQRSNGALRLDRVRVAVAATAAEVDNGARSATLATPRSNLRQSRRHGP